MPEYTTKAESENIKCFFKFLFREKENMQLFYPNQSPWQPKPLDSVWPLFINVNVHSFPTVVWYFITCH